MPEKMPGLMAIALSAPMSLPAFAAPADFDFLTFAAWAHFSSDKQWCDEHYPQFKHKNDAIWANSIFGQGTLEKFIKSTSSGDLTHKLLDSLPGLRAERQAEYATMPPRFLQNMCSAFDHHLGRENIRDKDAQTSPAPRQ